MKNRFAGQATKLAGIAARHLGWRPDDFWNVTPADLMLALCPPDEDAAMLSRDDLNTMLERDRNG